MAFSPQRRTVNVGDFPLRLSCPDEHGLRVLIFCMNTAHQSMRLTHEESLPELKPTQEETESGDQEIVGLLRPRDTWVPLFNRLYF